VSAKEGQQAVEAKDKTSYLDSVGQSNCNSEVEQAGPQDTDKTLG
jgi:hypothetical protein